MCGWRMKQQSVAGLDEAEQFESDRSFQPVRLERNAGGRRGPGRKRIPPRALNWLKQFAESNTRPCCIRSRSCRTGFTRNSNRLRLRPARVFSRKWRNAPPRRKRSFSSLSDLLIVRLPDRVLRRRAMPSMYLNNRISTQRRKGRKMDEMSAPTRSSERRLRYTDTGTGLLEGAYELALCTNLAAGDCRSKPATQATCSLQRRRTS